MNLRKLWKLWRTGEAAGGEPLSEEVRSRLASDFSMTAERAATLRMVTKAGRASGRSVTYFRVFDPVSARNAGIELYQYADFDRHPQFQLYYGAIETGGGIVLSRTGLHPYGNAQ